MRIALYPNIHKDGRLSLTAKVAALLDARGAQVVISDEYSGLLSNVAFVDEKDLFSDVDYAVVTGGDGTVIKAAHLAAPLGVSVIGVNLGAVGYLTALDPDRLDRLNCLFDGGFDISERMMLNAEYNGKSCVAVNDFIVSADNVSQMIKLSLSLSDGYELEYKCTGLVFSTPTGSTAYNLSAGGPVIDPRLDCIAVTPICPHGFSQKSTVFPPDAVISVKNVSSQDKAVFLTPDGADGIPFDNGGELTVSSSLIKAKFVFLSGDSGLRRLKEKLK